MPHPDEGLIHAWLDGELDAAEAARIEALVANDAEWAAAAAEARGLIAASARIVDALDRVPANVIPKAVPARRASRRWVWQAAAAVLLVAGSAVVLQREKPELPLPKTAVAVSAPPVPLPAVARADSSVRIPAALQGRQKPALDAKVAGAKKNRDHKSELADARPAEPALDKDAAAPPSELQGRVPGAGVPRAGADVAGAERRAANAPMAAAAQAGGRPAAQPVAPSAAPSAEMFATQRLTRLPASCFAQRMQGDSAVRIIRLSAAALADSIRLQTLALHGDTLHRADGELRGKVSLDQARRFTAIRVPCPEP